SNLSLAKARPNSEHNNGQSPSHLKVQKNVSSNQKQRRYSDQGEHAFCTLSSAVSWSNHSCGGLPQENDHKEEGSAQARKSSSSGSRGMAPPSPMLGNANNPNKADIPDRKKSAGAPGVS
ncbi:hypothetical protein M9458_040793, partial [Cirrhinus mrigala]